MIGLALKAWDFAKSPMGRRVLLLAIAALVVWRYGEMRYDAGVKHERGVWEEAQKKAEAKARKVAAESDKATDKVKADLAAANIRIAALSTKLRKEIPRYVSTEADRRCVIPVGYVRLRDAAGSGSSPVPEAPGGSLDADSGLVLSQLAENDIANAAAFNAAIAEVKAWRGWYPLQADIWKKEYGAPKASP